jgi:prenyltransferase beta subunit
MKPWLAACLLTLSCLAPIPAQTPTRVEKETTLSWVHSCQKDSGGFAPDHRPGTAATLPATSAALRAIKYFGGQVKERPAVVRFVTSCYDKVETGFAPTPGGKPDPLTTSFGLLAVNELDIRADDLRVKPVIYLCSRVKKFEEMRLAAAAYEALKDKCELSADWIVAIGRKAHDDGTYGKGSGVARDTAGAVVTILRLGGKVDHLDNVVKAIKEAQRKDGAWGKEGEKASDLETTYRVMRAVVMLKESPRDVVACRQFLSRCRNEDGSYSVSPGQPGTMSATYFAGIIYHWLDKAK